MSGKFALIIGNTEYIDPGLTQLTAPGRDAEDFASVLRNQDICSFDQVNILMNPLSSTVVEAIDEFFDQKKQDDLLLLYFSGHGVRDELGSLYLAVKNTIRSRLRSTAVRSDYIREAMDQCRSKRQVLILDCCNSGAFPQGTKAEVGGSMGMTSAFQGYGRFVLTASDATQFAWEGDKVIGQTDNSLFTHFLVKGLEGEADSDGDGRITVDELYDYAFHEIARVTPKQTPTKSASRQEGEIVLRQGMPIEDIKPFPLPAALLDSIENPLSDVRLGSVQQLIKLLNGKNLGLARSAREALERIAEEDDSRQVSRAAALALGFAHETRPPRIRKETQAVQPKDESPVRHAEQSAPHKEAEAEARQRAKEEAERLLSRQKAEEEAERKAEEEREAQKEAKRLAAAKAKEERLAREKLEAENKAREEAERLLAEEKAEKERLAKEKRLARAKAEAERKAREEAEKEPVPFTRVKSERLSEEKSKRVERGRQVSGQTVPAKNPPLSPGVVGAAIFFLVLCGFLGIRLLPGLLGGPAATATEAPFEEPVATEPPATEAPTPAPTEAPPGTTCAGAQPGDELSIVYHWSGQEEEQLLQILQPLVDVCGINLITESVSDQTLIDERVFGGTPPDVLFWYSLIPGYQEQLFPMDELGAGDVYIPGAINPGMIAGQWLGLPVKSDIQSLIWYSPAYFDSFGYIVPTTWDELDTLVEQMAADGFVPWSMGMESGSATGWVASSIIQDILLVQQGPEYVNGIIDGSIPYNDEGVRLAYETYYRWAADPYYALNGTDGTLSLPWVDAIYKPFSDPPEAMLVQQGGFAGSFIQSQFPDLQYGINYDFFVIPEIQGLQGNSDMMMAFNDKPVVQALVAYLSSAVGGANWANANFGLSPNYGAAGYYTDPALIKKADVFYNTGGITRHIGDVIPGFYNVEWEIIVAYLQGGDLGGLLDYGAQVQAEALNR